MRKRNLRNLGNSRNNEKGIALLIVLMALFLVAAVGMGEVRISDKMLNDPRMLRLAARPNARLLYWEAYMWADREPSEGLIDDVVIPGFALLAINGLWISILLGLVSTRFRDVPPIVGSFLQVLFFMTPIIWPAEMLGR